jgi:TonB family protein
MRGDSMSRSRGLWLFIATSVFAFASMMYAPVRGFAQSNSEVKQSGTRKVKSVVKPDYPEVARQMRISGTVRLEATVAADGKVRDTKVVGGSPLLAQEAANAVRKWRYEESPKETTETVEVVFNQQ